MTPYRLRVSRRRKRGKKAKVAKLSEKKKHTKNTANFSPKPSTSNARRQIDFDQDPKSPRQNSGSSPSDLDSVCANIHTPNTTPKKNRRSNQPENEQGTSKRSETPQISFISDDELESIQNHQLMVEIENTSHNDNFIKGNRIVEIDYYTKKIINLQYDHGKICTFGKLCPIEEDRRGCGLISTIKLRCSMCLREYSVSTENPEKNQSVINTAAVWGTLAVGSTFAHLEELHSIMDIPPMQKYMFHEIEMKLGNLWKDSLWETMKSAGVEERKIAINNGRLDTDQVPIITVYLDGGWSKRSYGHNYNAASGVGVIIGKETGKVLWVGVRNKYCTVCARAANKKENAPEHICFRNWSGSSSAMEVDIIVEGFSKSEEMHGVRYLTFIADGDSSVYAQIRKKVDYGQRVEKIECMNHVVENYGKSLHAIKTDKSIPPNGRKLITNKLIKDLQTSVQQCIYLNALNSLDTLKKIKKHTEPIYLVIINPVIIYAMMLGK